MPYICYVGPCVVCHEDTMLADEDSSGICSACTPHVCVPELPGDDYCDLCGNYLPSTRQEYPVNTVSTYNGWTNYETWAISLMMNNDYPTYVSMCNFMAKWDENDLRGPYMAFIKHHGMSTWRVGAHYADRFTFATRNADRAELDEMMREIAATYKP